MPFTATGSQGRSPCLLKHVTCDVIVMGRVGHRGLSRLLGSTTESLLYKMPCSVWVVSPERFD